MDRFLRGVQAKATPSLLTRRDWRVGDEGPGLVSAATGRSRSAPISFVCRTWLDALDIAVAGDGPLPPDGLATVDARGSAEPEAAASHASAAAAAFTASSMAAGDGAR